MRYKFYIVSGGTFTPTGSGYATISGGTTYDLEKDFDGLLVSKIKGLDDKGEIKNRYTETYADSEKLRVYHPTTPLYKETTIKLDILFSKALRGYKLDAFTNLIKGGTLIMYETSRGRCFEFVYMKDTIVSDERMYGGQPYKEVEFELQNIRGYCDRFVLDVYNINDTLTTRYVSTFVGATNDFVNNRAYSAGARFRLKKGGVYLAWEVVQAGWSYDRTGLTDDQFTAILTDMQVQQQNPPVKQVGILANQVVKSGGHYYLNTTYTQYAQIASYIADSNTTDITASVYADNTTSVKTINMTTSRIYYTGSGFVKALSDTKFEVYPICDGGVIVKWMSANNTTYGVTQNSLYVMDGTLFVAKPSTNPA
jgi:hypothetical protein